MPNAQNILCTTYSGRWVKITVSQKYSLREVIFTLPVLPISFGDLDMLPKEAQYKDL
jgi:hypothetical protein